MKKNKWFIIIGLIIIVCIIGIFIGYKVMNKETVSSAIKGVKTTEASTKSSNTVANETKPTQNLTIQENSAQNKVTQNNNQQKVITQNTSTKVIKAENENTQEHGTQNSELQKENIQTKGAITYTVPNGSYGQNTVLVTNTTGQNISSGLLNEYLRSWIMNGQNNCEGVCDATGTFWGQPWLDKVSNKTVVNAFIDANGEAALSKNITASEFVKTTQQLDLLTINSVPFTLAQAKAIILNMLQQDNYATPSEVTKIVLEQGAPSVYEVYTKQSGNNIYWTVDANTGYAHG